MKNILSIVLSIVFVVGGATAADFIKSGDTQAHKSGDTSDKGGKHTKPKQKSHGSDSKSKSHKNSSSHDKKSKNKHGSDHDADPKTSGDSVYFKFGRQFVVPVINSGRVQSLVMLDINLELGGSVSEDIYSMEPKLRDAVMRALISLSNDGVFDDQMTNPENYDMVRTRLRRATDEVIKGSVRDVLILDIARQDQ